MALAAAFLFLMGFGGPSDGPLESRSIALNGTASVLVERAVALGIDFGNESLDENELSADGQALTQASPGAWLDAQIQVGDESIAEAPRALREYLEARGDSVWSIVAALEKQPPEWKDPKDRLVLPFPYLLPSIRLQKVLLAVALNEERNGNSINASRALEASWSLARPFAERSLLIHQIVAVAAQKGQAGVLRKMKEPALQWLGRLGNNEPWRQILDSVTRDGDWSEASDALTSADPFSELIRKAPRSIAEGLEKLPPCDAAALGEEEVWHFAARELVMASSQETAESRRVYREIFLPNVLSMIHRVARLSVDRELTLEILKLRFEKAGDPAGRWPEKMLNAVSAVCPAASYSYRSGANGMEIRFEGSIVDPPSGSVLPLSFRSGHSRPPELTPSPTPTPAPPEIEPEALDSSDTPEP
ncbi:MAG: hypothetical protein WEB59_06020 [Thermoanaerobaculia bacterium]